MELSAPKPVVETAETGGVIVKVVVVSNRVARRSRMSRLPEDWRQL